MEYRESLAKCGVDDPEGWEMDKDLDTAIRLEVEIKKQPMSIDQFDEDSYEQTLIELFQGMGYQYECGYDVERDFREPYYADDLRKSLRRLNRHRARRQTKRMLTPR